jgi:hypothetical protein
VPDRGKIREMSNDSDWDWDFEGTRRHHLKQGLRLTPEERLRWLEETVEEMRALQGLAKKGRPMSSVKP